MKNKFCKKSKPTYKCQSYKPKKRVGRPSKRKRRISASLWIKALRQKNAKETGLSFNELKFRKLEKRWGSCTASNNIILNIDAIKLPFSLIDYLIAHELVHTKIKNHSKEFWAEVSKHVSNWKVLDRRMQEMRL